MLTPNWEFQGVSLDFQAQLNKGLKRCHWDLALLLRFALL